MGKKALSDRKNWQTETGPGPGGLAGTAEKNLFAVFKKAFEGTIYEIQLPVSAYGEDGVSLTLTYDSEQNEIKCS